MTTRGPKGEKRPGNVIGAAVMVAKIATKEIKDETKDPAAVSLGSKGGKARAKSLSDKQRKEIAKKGAKARWE